MTWSHPKMPFPQRVRLLFSSLSPSKFGDEISSFADSGCLSRILDPNFFHPRSRILDQNFLHPGSLIPDLNFFSIPDPGSRVRIKEFKYFNQKKWFLSSQKYDPSFRSRIRIPDLDPDFLPIPDPESRDQKGTGSLIPDAGSGFATLEISGLLRLQGVALVTDFQRALLS
jgi:hypothetical protein